MGVASLNPPVHFALDRSSALPVYQQLKWHIIRLVGCGDWPPGTPVPSIRQLGAELDVATATIQRTYRELQAEGVLVGRVGRGMFVADFTTKPSVELPDRLAALRQHLDGPLTQARGMGFGAEEILQVTRELVESEPRTTHPRVVYIGRTQDFCDKYRALLQQTLADLDVTVDAVLLRDLEQQGDALLQALEPITVVVSLVSQYATVRRLLGTRQTPHFGLVVDLTEETQHALISLPEDVPIGVVTEEHYLATARALVSQYRATEENLHTAAVTDHAALERVIQTCPVVVYSFGLRPALTEWVSDQTRLIELRYEPKPSSIARLRGLFTTTHDLGR